MHIKSIIAGLANTVRWKQPARPPNPANSPQTHTTAQPKPLAEALAASSSVFRQIASDYDVTKITPKALSEMLQRLHESGGISDAEFQEMSAIRLDLDAEGISPDQPVNLVDFYTERLKRLREDQAFFSQKAGECSQKQRSLESVQRRLEWVRKLALIQSPQGQSGLDKAA